MKAKDARRVGSDLGPHPKAKMDEDGHCTVCGLEVREWEDAPDDAEAMRRHRCPPGFYDSTSRSVAGHTGGKVGP